MTKVVSENCPSVAGWRMNHDGQQNHWNRNGGMLQLGVGGKAWKMSAEATKQYVKRLFNTCIKLYYYPLLLRYAISIMLKKPEKAIYTTPNN